MSGTRRTGTLLTLGLLGLAVSGCQKTETTTENTTSTSTTTASADNSATGTKGGGDGAGKKYKIVYIPKNTGNPYFEAVDNGFKKPATS